jgi:hypothetical protein
VAQVTVRVQASVGVEMVSESPMICMSTASDGVELVSDPVTVNVERKTSVGVEFVSWGEMLSVHDSEGLVVGVEPPPVFTDAG